MLYNNSSNLPIPIFKFSKPVKAGHFVRLSLTEKNIASKPAGSSFARNGTMS